MYSLPRPTRWTCGSSRFVATGTRPIITLSVNTKIDDYFAHRSKTVAADEQTQLHAAHAGAGDDGQRPRCRGEGRSTDIRGRTSVLHLGGRCEAVLKLPVPSDSSPKYAKPTMIAFKGKQTNP